MVLCQICQEEVMEPKFDIHYRKHMRDLKRREMSDGEDGNQDDESQTDTPPLKKRTTRRAALMANSRLEEFVKAERIGEDGKEIISDEDPDNDEEFVQSEVEASVKDSKDKDYAAEEESEKSEESSDGSYEDIPEILTTQNQEWFRNKLEKDWTNHYRKPVIKPKDLDTDQKQKWKAELTEQKYICCTNEGCTKRLLSIAAAAKHKQLCGDDSFYVCLLCPGSRPMRNRSVKKFYAHMVKHRKASHQGDSESTKLLGYRKFLLALPEKQKKLFNLDKLEVNPKLTKYAFSYCENHHSAEAFSGFRPLRSDWVVVSNPDDYLPIQRESINFKIRRLNEDSLDSWNKLNLFEVLDSKMEPVEHTTLNAGGSVWASAWCPTPLTESASKDIEQYASFSISLDFESQHKMTDITKCKGLIQIWNFGNLNQKILESTPRLALAIGHNYGEIRDMKWCPSGCWDQPDESFQTPEILPRLGLLALACGDGCVRVLSVPHPEALQSRDLAEKSVKVYSTVPVFLMNSPENGLVSTSQKSCCTCIAFEKTDGHAKLAAGYGNGLISLWDLRSNSPLVVACRRRPGSKGTPPLPQTLRPFHVFLAHSASVLSLTFSPVPNGRFLVTSGMDKLSRVWDLDDTSIPYDNFKKALGHDVSWSCHWCGYFMATDECYNFHNCSSFFKECGYYDFSSMNVTNHNSSVWKTSVSDWLNCEASCDVAGVVNMTILPSLSENYQNLKSLKNKRWPIFSTEVCPLVDESDDKVEVKSPNTKKSSNTIAIKTDPSLYLYNTHAKITEKFGLVFIDAPLSSYNQLSSPEARSLTISENMPQLYPGQYPIASVNNVSWNPNLGSHYWLLTAGQAGLVRLSCFSAIRVPSINRLLAKVTKDNERT